MGLKYSTNSKMNKLNITKKVKKLSGGKTLSIGTMPGMTKTKKSKSQKITIS